MPLRRNVDLFPFDLRKHENSIQFPKTFAGKAFIYFSGDSMISMRWLLDNQTADDDAADVSSVNTKYWNTKE